MSGEQVRPRDYVQLLVLQRNSFHNNLVMPCLVPLLRRASNSKTVTLASSSATDMLRFDTRGCGA
eukprot:2682888-Amphidinium_carterae.1